MLTKMADRKNTSRIIRINPTCPRNYLPLQMCVMLQLIIIHTDIHYHQHSCSKNTSKCFTSLASCLKSRHKESCIYFQVNSCEMTHNQTKKKNNNFITQFHSVFIYKPPNHNNTISRCFIM